MYRHSPCSKIIEDKHTHVCIMTVLMSPDRTKHMSTVVKINQNDTKT